MNALSRLLASLALVAVCLGLSSCYTQLSAADARTARADGYRIPADRTADQTAEDEAPTWTGDAARVGLGHDTREVEQADDYGEVYAEGDYADGEVGGEYYDDVQVTRYRYDEGEVDDYYGSDYYGGGYYDPYYVSYAPYYRPRRAYWHHLYSPFYPAPRWAYGYDPFFDLHYRSGFGYHSGWSFNIGFSYGSPYYGGYYDPYYAGYYGYSPVFYGGYSSGYSSGYYNGYNAGTYNGGGYYSGAYYGNTRGGRPRGSIRSALGPDRPGSGRTRLRALAETVRDDGDGRVLLDSPLGISSVRTLASNTRQHVLVQQADASNSIRTPASVRGNGTRVRDRDNGVVSLPDRSDRLGVSSPGSTVRPSRGVQPERPARVGAETIRPPRTTRTAPNATPTTREPRTRPSTRPVPTRTPRTERPNRTPRTERTKPEPSTRRTPARRAPRSTPTRRSGGDKSRPASRPSTPRSQPSRSSGGSKARGSSGSPSRGSSTKRSGSGGSSSRSNGRGSGRGGRN